MFQEQSSGEGFEGLKDLIRQFEDMRDGHSHTYLDEDSFEMIIDYYDDQNNLPVALQAAEMAMAQFPYSSWLMLKKADLLIEESHYGEALSLIGKAETLDPNDINVYILKTDAYMGLRQHEKAVALLEENLERFSGEDRTELLLELADVYDDWEEFDKVFDCLKMALEYEPANEEALHKICFWTEFTGRTEESIRLHRRILEDSPYNELAWFNLGTAFQELKLYEKAVDAYLYAIAINEKFEYAYRNLADAYIRLRNYPEAIHMLERHMEIAKPEDVIYEAMGHCYEKQKKYDQARYYYRKAYHLNPGDDHLYFRVGRTYMMEMQWMQAIQYLLSARKLNTKSAEYCLALAECYLQTESYKDALAQLLEAIRLRPASSRARLHFVRGLYLSGYLEEALLQLDLAEKETGHKAAYRYYRCGVLLMLGRSKEALLQLESALAESPRQFKKLLELNPTVLQHSGVVDIVVRYKHKK